MQQPALLDKKMPVVVRMPFTLFTRGYSGNSQKKYLKLARQVPNTLCSYRDSTALNSIIIGGNKLEITDITLNFDDNCLILEGEAGVYQSRGNHSLLTEYKNDGWIIVEEDHRPTENQLDIEIPGRQPVIVSIDVDESDDNEEDDQDVWADIKEATDEDSQEELEQKAQADDEITGAAISPVVESSEITYEEISPENNGDNNENKQLVENVQSNVAALEDQAVGVLETINENITMEAEPEKELETVEANSGAGNGEEENETTSISDDSAGKGANRSRRRQK